MSSSTRTTTPRRLATAFLLCFIAGFVKAQVEVQVDDNDPAIVYSPEGSWFRGTERNEMAAGGFHMATEDMAASATLRFTGTGIKYMAPLWAEEITTQVRLDGGVPVLINLQDTTVPAEVGGPTTVESSVLWEERGLTNTEHVLIIEVAPGGRYAVVDMLVVEQNTPSNTTTKVDGTSPITTGKETSTSSTRSDAAASTSPTAKPTPAATSRRTIIIAVVWSVVGLLFIISLLFFLARRRRQRRSEPPLAVVPPHTQAIAQIPSHPHPQHHQQQPIAGTLFYQKPSMTPSDAPTSSGLNNQLGLANDAEQPPPDYEAAIADTSSGHRGGKGVALRAPT